ncbi:MAG TPA: beta-phosphoglucomutase family hydrolase [Vicinamibacterales bacterium]|nr:beta-phosphoglucomutase family hydrolase [Vicinamibacterales bacterium]
MSSRAVLWDMDGTLIDSAEYHWLTWRDTLANAGCVLTHDDFASWFGQRNDAILRRYLGPDARDDVVRRLGDAKEAAYRAMVKERGIAPLPGVSRWLRRLREEGWRQAVASSAPPENIRVILEALDVSDCFQALVSAEEVAHGKPAPDVFLLAAERLGVPPSRCIVVEDAPAGVEAGRRGGMKTIGIASLGRPLDADVVVTSLEELPATAFDDLLAVPR